MQTNHSAALAAFLAANPGANSAALLQGASNNTNSNQGSSHGGTQSTSPPFDPRSASLQAALLNSNSGSNHSASLASLDPSSSLLQQVSQDADAMNVAQLRTANLLNQYFARQQQIEQQEKMLLAHRLASTLGTTGGNTTSSLVSSVSGPQPLLPLPNSAAAAAASSLNNNSGNALHSENALLLELLRRKEQQDQQALQLKQLQELRSSSSLYPLVMTGSSDASSAPLLSQLQRLQQEQQQPSSALLSLQLLAQLGGSGGSSAALYPSLLRNHAASQAATQMDSRALASSNDALLAQLLQQQNSAASRLAPHAESSADAPSFERSLVDAKPPRPEGTSLSSPSKSRRTGSKLARRKGRVGKFPLKLHQLLHDLAREGRSDIAAFLPHGRAFAIFKPAEFAAEVMPHYFRMSRFSSFQRQLNLYDFQRVVEGTDKGSYFHQLFIEGQPNISSYMKRNKIKGHASKAREEEPKGVPSETKADVAAPTEEDDDEEEEEESTEDDESH